MSEGGRRKGLGILSPGLQRARVWQPTGCHGGTTTVPLSGEVVPISTITADRWVLSVARFPDTGVRKRKTELGTRTGSLAEQIG